ADTTSATTTLSALKTIKETLGCHTSLGVSNVSFGLPNRDAINGTFFALALENGLSAAIMNPYSADMMKVYYTFKALKGLDENCGEYISAAEKFVTEVQTASTSNLVPDETYSECQHAIIKGLRDKAGEITKSLLENTPPLEIVNREIIPALNIMGERFENKTAYLPQLLMSAEAAKGAFETIKDFMVSNGEEKTSDKDVFVLATVHGDIHDIGKNIVKLLLENYGFNVIDLGKDVPPEEIVEKVVKLHAPIVGLSALMTTTVEQMEETIKLLRKDAPWCRVVVGGAVLTPEYADKIGADKYAKDAMEGVRYAQKVTGK
ncbi:MAG: cobalamin-dependent protein, partial [Oscillospiraceae bacterium]|nr:cobalamin-dependent protein [Oscillospiraceae bacterium]